MKKTWQKGDKEGEDEINNEFIITIMTDADNVSGLQEQEKFVESIVNKFDVRICVMMETGRGRKTRSREKSQIIVLKRQ